MSQVATLHSLGPSKYFSQLLEREALFLSHLFSFASLILFYSDPSLFNFYFSQSIHAHEEKKQLCALFYILNQEWDKEREKIKENVIREQGKRFTNDKHFFFFLYHKGLPFVELFFSLFFVQ